jgi:hypothetical protein
MTQILVLGTWFTALRLLASAAVLALGRPKWLAFAHAAQIAGMALLIPVGYALFGFLGAIVGLAAAQVGSYAALLVVTQRMDLRAWRQDCVLSAGFMLVGGAGWVVRAASRSAHLPSIAEGALLVLLVAGFWGAAFVNRAALAALSARTPSRTELPPRV